MAFLVSENRPYYPRIQEVATREEADALAKQWIEDDTASENGSIDTYTVWVSEVITKTEFEGY